jgi:hypothetical protein
MPAYLRNGKEFELVGKQKKNVRKIDKNNNIPVRLNLSFILPPINKRLINFNKFNLLINEICFYINKINSVR